MPIARIARIAVPWEVSTWCIARAAARMSRRPGAWMPRKWESQLTHHISLMGATRPDAVADPAHDDLGEIAEPARDVGVVPAAPVGERGGQFPVVERRRGLDPAGEEAVDEPVVEVEPFGVHLAAPSGITRAHEVEKR